MKKSDEKLRQSLLEAMAMDDAKLEEEMENVEQHIFSEKFERNMEKLFEQFKRRRLWGIGMRKYFAGHNYEQDE